MSIIAVLPARMGSSRFPGKPMAKIRGLPMIEHCYRRVKMSKLIQEVYVATCDEEIYDHVESIGGKAVMTADSHERCSDRCAEAMLKVQEQTGEEVEILMMVQGDEPLVRPEMVDHCVKPLLDREDLPIANLYSKIACQEEFEDPNTVKVVMDRKEHAIYFSREPIPSRKKFNGTIPMYRQLGLIAFRGSFLLKYNQLEPTILEEIESVDMMRVIEHGYPLQMVLSETRLQPVDTPPEISIVESLMEKDDLLEKYL